MSSMSNSIKLIETEIDYNGIIHSDDNIVRMEIQGISNNNIILMYALEEYNCKYITLTTNINTNNTLLHIIDEFVSDISLWIIQSMYVKQEQHVVFTVYLNMKNLPKYINYSLAFKKMYKQYLNNKNVNNLQLKNIIPDTDCYELNNFNVPLYQYQKKSLSKMINIENKTIYKVSIHEDIIIDEKNITKLTKYNYNSIFNKLESKDNQKYIELNSVGGFLSDEMGLGKTITSLALIKANQCTNTSKYIIDNKSNLMKIKSKATLILCPSHLINQWKKEMIQCYGNNYKIVSILTKSDYNKYSCVDYINADIIITSFQFITNVDFYLALHFTRYYRHLHYNRINTINNYIVNNFTDSFDLMQVTNPLFEFFYFHRFIIDEAHEVFNNAYNKILLRHLLENITSTYRWYVSGTPVFDPDNINEVFKFIGLTINIPEYQLSVQYNSIDVSNPMIYNTIKNNYLWVPIVKQLMIRHLENDIKDQIKIPMCKTEIIWITLTNNERKYYDVKALNSTNVQLLQMCCHPIILNSNRKVCGNEDDINIIKVKMLEHYKKLHSLYTNKIENLDSSKPEYYMVKKKYESIQSESNYMINILNLLNDDPMNDVKKLADGCVICMEENMDNPIMTSCGHFFCHDCIVQALNIKNICPVCKTNLQSKKLIRLEHRLENLFNKYGSKIATIITEIKKIVENPSAKILVFSQWDNMLSLISKILEENDLSNTFIKGNVHCRNSSIDKFKNDDNSNNIIMLSLKNSASGTNFNNATHILFVDIIDDTKDNIEMIENQAIGRAHRIGQKNPIKIIRILTKDTIEEEIYKKKYMN